MKSIYLEIVKHFNNNAMCFEKKEIAMKYT